MKYEALHECGFSACRKNWHINMKIIFVCAIFIIFAVEMRSNAVIASECEAHYAITAYFSDNRHNQAIECKYVLRPNYSLYEFIKFQIRLTELPLKNIIKDELHLHRSGVTSMEKNTNGKSRFAPHDSM